MREENNIHGKVRQSGCTSRGDSEKKNLSPFKPTQKASRFMYLPQPGICFGCDCWSQRLTLLWAPVRLQSHRLRKTR